MEFTLSSAHALGAHHFGRKRNFRENINFSMEFIEKVADIADPFLTFNHS